MGTDETVQGDVRAAATLVVLRSAAQGLEVLLTTRPKHLRFMGGAAVFPGGAVAEADLDPAWEDATDRSPADAARVLGEEDPRAALAAFVCALRESYEEVGLLLGEGPLERIPRALADEPRRFLDACRGAGVVLGTRHLVPAGRWVTPLGSSVRFDARFFVTLAPEGWQPDPDPNEVAECMWISPAAALAEVGAGSMLMAPPTIEMLQLLDRYAGAAEALERLGDEGLAGAGNVLSVRLSPLVHVVLAPNPGRMTGPGTNTYIVGRGPTLVIDPAVDDDRYLEAVIAAAGDVTSILVTHRHADHVGGVRGLAAATGAPVRAWGGQPVDGVDVEPLADGDVVAAGGARLRALHTPGHASDHLSFLLEGAASLFAGDNVLGEGTAVIAPPDGSMKAYLESLEGLEKLHIDRIYPGHFRPLDGGHAVIAGYIRHRRERERKIVDALNAGASSMDEIVAEAYADTAVELHPLAAFSALAHLEMLEEVGRAKRVDDRWEPTGKD